MKYKLTSAILLLLCFSLLAIMSGAVPVMARSDPSSSDLDTAEPASEPASAETPSAAAAETPLPTETPVETACPIPTGTPAPETGEGLRRMETTITAEDPLDNDTYYELSADELLSEGVDLTLPKEGYQVLILHTHATEAYTPAEPGLYEETDSYRTTDPEYSVVRVGEELAEALSAYGLNVLHDTALYDYPSYNGSYERSGTAASEYLAAYPGIRLVIDLHRDALGDDEVIYSTVADLDGMDAAQMMFVMGSDVNLEHPGWRDNLRLALTLQAAVNAQYPTLMRPTVLCSYRYNQQLTPGYLLLEVGTSGNTLDEALTAVRLFAEAAGPLISTWIEE